MNAGWMGRGVHRGGVEKRPGSMLVSGFVVLALHLSTTDARAFDLGSLFRTPQQEAAAKLESGEHEALIEDAPDARWEGLARYRGGDADGAAAAFTRALEARDENKTGQSDAARNDLLFARATAETRAGRPAQALPLYDEILGNDPAHEDALHNREIAEALLALEQEHEQEQPGGNASDESGEGENPEEGQDSPEDGENSGGRSNEGDPDASDDSNPGDETDQADAAGDSSDESSDASGDAAGSSTTGKESEDGPGADPAVPDESEQQAARDALAAEAAAAGNTREDDASQAASNREGEAKRTPTEREQATEQWLRQISDDPAGLLRRRLEQNHRVDYPEVRESDEPW